MSHRIVNLWGDDAVAAGKVDGNSAPRPRNGGHIGGLSKDGAANFVSQSSHGCCRRPQEADVRQQSIQGRRQLWLLGGMAPADSFSSPSGCKPPA